MPSFLSGRYPAVKVRKKLYVTALVAAAVYRSRTLKKNWWKHEMFTSTKDYREALERAEFHVGFENGQPVTDAERKAAKA